VPAATVNFNQGKVDPANSFPRFRLFSFALRLYDLMQKKIMCPLNFEFNTAFRQQALEHLSSTTLIQRTSLFRAYRELINLQAAKIQTSLQTVSALKQYYHLAVMQQFLYSECETSTTSTPSQLQCTGWKRETAQRRPCLSFMNL
jgi:hypothetical protein